MGFQRSFSQVRRTRYRVRTQVFEYPSLYLPFARHKYRGHSPEVISSRTELVIEGYPPSANTFAVYAFQLSQDTPVRLAHHLHAPAQVIRAARRGIPVPLVLRDPEGTILSEALYDGPAAADAALPDALVAYSRFYGCLIPYLDSLVVGEFEQVTRDFGAVIRRVNAHFGTTFAEFRHTAESTRECFALMKHRCTLSEIVYGFESGVVSPAELRRQLPALACPPQPPRFRDAWIPSADRARLRPALRELWLQPGIARLRERAQSIYDTVRAAADPHERRLEDQAYNINADR